MLEAVHANPGELRIVSDSKYVLDCFGQGWREQWQRTDGSPARANRLPTRTCGRRSGVDVAQPCRRLPRRMAPSPASYGRRSRGCCSARCPTTPVSSMTRRRPDSGCVVGGCHCVRSGVRCRLPPAPSYRTALWLAGGRRRVSTFRCGWRSQAELAQAGSDELADEACR